MGTTNYPKPERYRIRRHMAEWRRQEGHGVCSSLERRWCADSRRPVIATQASRHGCLFLTCEGVPPLAVAILPDWVDTVDPIYRELLSREIRRDYARKLAVCVASRAATMTTHSITASMCPSRVVLPGDRCRVAA